ncbi:ecdysone 20-monooxygenase [Bacillus rossius redtenbacheri]|uniref:ecdysone 20-monooxygenase n=1 Tax=Bacillus rossius redtenbacheri TaxID=93214 RepID=UPI002FDEFF29
MLSLLKFTLGPLDIATLVVFALLLLCTDYTPSWWGKHIQGMMQRKPRGAGGVPGPLALPLLGTSWLYWRWGRYSLSRLHLAYRDMFRRYGPIVKEEALWNYPVVSLLDLGDISKVLRHPSRCPLRPPTEAIAQYRRSRPDRYASAGLPHEQGDKWHELRALLTPELVSRRTMDQFLPELQLVAEDLAALLRARRDAAGRVAGVLELANTLGLESICVLVLGRRLGFFNKDLGALASRLGAVIKEHFLACRDTYFGLPLWKLFPTRAYRQMVRSEEAYYEIISELVEAALSEERSTCPVDGIRSVFASVLRVPQLDVREKKAAIIDFIAAGIQGMCNSLVFLLYLMAKHPDCQRRLFLELQALGPLTAESLRTAPYLRACIHESYRLLPAAISIARILETDMELSGHLLPAGTVVLCHTWLAGQEERHFAAPEQFRPERWLSPDGRFAAAGSIPVVPFGYGKRMCPGKGFVDQELRLLLAKLIQEFHIGFEGELELQFEFFLSPAGPVSFSFTDRQ